MKIAVKGKSLNLPRLCTCCAQPNPETTHKVSDFQRRGNMRYTSTWGLPYCNDCKRHIDAVDMKWYDAISIIFSAGLYLIPYFLFTRPLRKMIAKKRYLKPTCCDLEAAGYEYFMIGDGKHVFDLKNTDFQRAFVAINKDALESGNPEIRVLLSGS